MRRSLLGFAAILLVSGSAEAAKQETMRGGVALIKAGKLLRIVASPAGSSIQMPDASSDPTVEGAKLRVWDVGGAGGSDTFALPADGWRRLPKSTKKPLVGYRYSGDGSAEDPCTAVVIKNDVVKATCKGKGVNLTPPFAGNVSVALTVGDDEKTFCCSFGGTEVKNSASLLKRKSAQPLQECEPGTTTTTLGGGTTSSTVNGMATTTTSLDGGETTTTSLGGGEPTSTTIDCGTTTTTTLFCDTTTTSLPGGTTSTTIGGGETTTTTIVGGTTSSTVPGETTTTVVTGETTTTTTGGGGDCCNGAGFLNFSTIDQPGDCGDIIDSNGMSVDLACAGLYSGGGGNSVPLPLTVPDLGQAVSAITACTGQSATLGGTTSTETGSNLNCTSTGCRFGAPLAVPNPGTPPTSVCVINFASAALNGMTDCGTGETIANLPLSSVLYLTGDTSTDPSATITGVQPCPLCSGGTCIGGPNNGMGCIAGTTDLGGDAAYPTSHDCPPVETANIGTLPIAFQLSSGTVQWNGSTATNDTGSTASAQNRVFAGFCRDANGTGEFTQPAQQCWENGMAVGAPCAEPNESCEQRSNGAFGPNGGANRTIRAIGSASSILSGAAPATLVSVFSIPPTFNATVDAAGDLPGPGAVAIPGNASLCADPSACGP